MADVLGVVDSIPARNKQVIVPGLIVCVCGFIKARYISVNVQAIWDKFLVNFVKKKKTKNIIHVKTKFHQI